MLRRQQNAARLLSVFLYPVIDVICEWEGGGDARCGPMVVVVKLTDCRLF